MSRSQTWLLFAAGTTVMSVLLATSSPIFPADLDWAVGSLEWVVLLLELGILATWPRRRGRAGRVIFDLGRAGPVWLEVLLWTLAVGMAAYLGVSTARGDAVELLEATIFLLGTAIVITEIRYGRRVTEGGVLHFMGFEAWDDVDLAWSSLDGVVVERRDRSPPWRAEGLGWLGLVVLSVTSLSYVHGRWVAPFAVTETGTVRFVPDDVYATPTVRFIHAPDRPLRAVFERESAGEPPTWIASVELGRVEEGDEVSAGWSGPEDRRRLVVRHDTTQHVVSTGPSIPTWRTEAVVLITRAEHPVDDRGRIVVVYAVPRERLDRRRGVENATTRVLLRFEEVGPVDPGP